MKVREPTSSNSRFSLIPRLRPYFTASGVIWWGVPTAVLMTVLGIRRDLGLSWASLTRGEFWIRLAINLVITGLVGGNLFDRGMRWVGLHPAARRAGHRAPPT